MADREEPTAEPETTDPPEAPDSPLDAWEELAPLRETFLHHAWDPETVAALRTIGEFFYEAILEWKAYETPGDPLVIGELRAVAKDARYLAGFLHFNTAQEGRATMEDKRRERWLQVKAEEWADTLSEVASEIEQAIA